MPTTRVKHNVSKILLLDGYNLMHRARYGFGKGDYNVVFNFFRGLKPIVEMMRPDKIYFVLEGLPKERIELYPEYKANRSVGLTPEKKAALEDFRRQREYIYDILSRMPITVLHHYDFECDDVIANVATQWHSDDDCVVISNDTDFIQLLSEHNSLRLYSPVKKQYLTDVDYDYVSWKALVGDSSDNIKGVPRVGKKTAIKILTNGLQEWLDLYPEKAEIYHRNVKLIKFADLSEKMEEIEVRSEEDNDFDYVLEKFQEMEFASMVTPKYWNAFKGTFRSVSEV